LPRANCIWPDAAVALAGRAVVGLIPASSLNARLARVRVPARLYLSPSVASPNAFSSAVAADEQDEAGNQQDRLPTDRRFFCSMSQQPDASVADEAVPGRGYQAFDFALSLATAVAVERFVRIHLASSPSWYAAILPVPYAR
jgi:hypothetical protein